MTREEEIALVALKVKNGDSSAFNVKRYAPLYYALRSELKDAKVETFGKSSRCVNAPIEFTKDFFSKNGIKIHNVRYIRPTAPLNIHHLDYIESITTIDSPFNIRVKQSDTKDKRSELVMIKPILPEEELKNYKPTYESIELYSVNNEDSKGLYTSEIARSQIESNQGLITDYVNRDAIEVFINLVTNFSISEKMNNSVIKNYLYELQRSIYFITASEMRRDLLTLEKRTVSIIKGLKLFEIYKESPFEVRKEMLDNVARIFNASLSVEDYLCLYGIPENETLTGLDVKKYTRKN